MSVSKIELSVALRNGTGKNEARRLRRAGQIPAIFYGHGEPAIAIQIDGRDMERVLRNAGHSTLLTIVSEAKEIGGKFALLREITRNPLTDGLVHIDLQGVRLDEEIHIKVPVKFVGKPVGEAKGGVTDVHFWELDVACRADSIPQEIVIDIAPLDIGDVIHGADIKLPAGVRLRTDARVAVVGIVEPKKEEVAAAAPTADATAAAGAGSSEQAAASGEKAAGDKASAAEKTAPKAGGDKGKK